MWYLTSRTLESCGIMDSNTVMHAALQEEIYVIKFYNKKYMNSTPAHRERTTS